MEHPYRRYLLNIGRPQQYTGGEWNSLLPPKEGSLEAGLPRVTLVYPDVYELGMSNFGLSILRHVLIGTGRFQVRRAFSPAPDLDATITAESLPWVDLEGWQPVVESRVVGFTVPCESLYTNILHLIDLMGLPLRSADRSGDQPLLVFGGGGLANPLPLAPFADLIFLGEVEEQAERLFTLLAGEGSRRGRLKAAAEVPGVYVPSLGRRKVELQRVSSLKTSHAPVDQVVPNARVSQDRAVVEIARGCTRGCRFCQASQLYRPVRERSAEDALSILDAVLCSTGWEKAGMLTLSLSDHSQLPRLLEGMERVTAKHHAASSMPSMRPDTILRIEEGYDVTGRLTIAPEAGTPELRNRINKPMEDGTILEAVRTVFSSGARGVKLYFIVGLPMETEEDVRGIGRLALEVAKVSREFRLNPRKTVTVALSPFVPKALTPLQWAPQMKEEEIWRRIGIVRRICGRKVNLSWNSPRVAAVEAILSLGDDGTTADVLEEATRRGARFDAWTDMFRWDIWSRIIEEYPVLEERLRLGLDQRESLPWEFISTGVSRDFLEREYRLYGEGETTTDCRISGCWNCGACGGGRGTREEKGSGRLLPNTTRVNAAPPGEDEGGSAGVLRVRYSKKGAAAYTSHLDTVRMWGRVLRRSGLPVSWSGGYVRRPRVQFGPPLPLGMESVAEYVDIRLETSPGSDPGALLSGFMPAGFNVEETWILGDGASSPDKSPVAAVYTVVRSEFWNGDREKELAGRLRGMDAVLSVDIDNETGISFMVPADDREARPDILLDGVFEGPVTVRRVEVYLRLGEEGWRSIASHSSDLEKILIEG
ncbi:MAG: hypothetical protein AVO35_07220 [Candidatus Aegiribacteria sp. MLS_C]|nr:MAG: hypothetical protein AVO35_07220 [Candidatus Aegiribacteria sp. MLS_C]